LDVIDICGDESEDESESEDGESEAEDEDDEDDEAEDDDEEDDNSSYESSFVDKDEDDCEIVDLNNDSSSKNHHEISRSGRGITFSVFRNQLFGKGFAAACRSPVFRNNIEPVIDTIISTMGNQSHQKCYEFQKTLKRTLTDPRSAVTEFYCGQTGRCSCCNSTKYLSRGYRVNSDLTWFLGSRCHDRIQSVMTIFKVLRRVSLDTDMTEKNVEEAYNRLRSVLSNAIVTSSSSAYTF
jgi:hypothetical protein